jgi:hypothetical protein
MRDKREAALRKQRGGGLDATAGNRLHLHSTRPEPPRQPAHGRIIESGRTWQKTVRASVHLRRKPFAGWAADVEDVLAARALGVRWLRLDDAESGQRYWASVNDVAYKGQLFDYGHGPQLCLALDAWHVGEHAPEPVGVQGVLF